MAGFNPNIVLKDQWYPGCASSRLGSDKPFATQIGDHRIVLFRDANGTPHAFKDRCPHMFAELSKGTVKDGCLKCPFHGLEFDGEGKCVLVPSDCSGREPKLRLQNSYPCAERDHYVWVWIGDAEPSAPPELPELAALSGYPMMQGSSPCDANWQLGIAISMDTMHTGYVHGEHFCYPKEDPSKTERNECFFAVFNHGGEKHTYRILTRETGQTVLVDNEPTKLVVKFDLPGRIVAIFQNHVTQEGETPHPTVIVLQFVPLGPEKSRMEFLIAPIPPGEGDKVIWVEHAPNILQEDLDQIASVQRNLKEGDAFGFVQADISVVRALTIISLAAEGKWPEARANEIGTTKSVDVRS